MTSDEFSAAARMLANGATVQQVVKTHGHIDKKFWDRPENIIALYNTAGVDLPPELAKTAKDVDAKNQAAQEKIEKDQAARIAKQKAEDAKK
jgi:hypothetical protein